MDKSKITSNWFFQNAMKKIIKESNWRHFKLKQSLQNYVKNQKKIQFIFLLVIKTNFKCKILKIIKF